MTTHGPTDEFLGQAAIVTGGSQGIGYAIARRFAASGAAVTICARRGERVDDAVRRLRNDGGRIHGLAADVRDPAQVERVVGETVREFGRVDILVNNAGAGQIRDSATLPLEAWREVLDTHLTGAFLMSQSAARIMLPRRSGVILNIGSIFSIRGMPKRAAYATAKHGIVGLTRALACEWAPHGVRVLVLGPGYVDTPREIPIDFSRDLVEKRTPMGRWETPDELAEVAAFLCSARAGFVTGTLLMADGGWTSYGGW